MGSLHDARLGFGRARDHAPVAVLRRISTVRSAPWAMRACHGFDGSRPRSREPLECFHSATCPQPLQANRRSAWGRRLQQRCVNRDKTSVFARSAAYTTHQLRRRGCRCVLVRLQTLAQLFFHQPAAGVSARQQLISTTASKPLVSCAQRCGQAPRTRCLYYLTDQGSQAHARRGDT